MFRLWRISPLLGIKNPSIKTDCANSFLHYINFAKNSKRCLSTSLPRFADDDSRNNTERRVYYGKLTPQIRGVKIFSLTSSIAGIIAQPIIYREASTLGNMPLLVAACGVVGFFTFVTPILLHLITKKYVIQIDYNSIKDTYTATTISFLLARKQLEFKKEDVVVPEIPGMFTSFLVKGKPLFVELGQFDDPVHYAKLMGYDKPMDFHMGTINAPPPKRD